MDAPPLPNMPPPSPPSPLPPAAPGWRRARYVVALVAPLLLLGVLLAALAFFVRPAAAQGEPVAPSPAQGGEPGWAGGRGPGGGNRGGPGDPEDGDVSGWIVARPEGATGLWELQCTPSEICLVKTTAETRFRDGALAVTSGWVEAEGAFEGDILVAERLRLDDYEGGEVVVRLQTGVISTSFALENELTPVGTLLDSANIHLFTSDEDDLDEELAHLRHEDEVIWAEPNYVGSIPDHEGFKTWKWGGQASDGYVNQAAFAQVVLTPAHAIADGTGMVVAVLDTGVDLNHSALAGRLLPGRDVVADDALAMDEGPGFGWGHGTHVAGIIARVAPGAQILPVRVLNHDGRGNIFTLAYAVEWAVLNGADVINLSLGADGGSRLLEDTLAWAQGQGVVIVAAAGNEDTGAQQFPAGFSNVIGVAAIDAWGRKAPFSNYGAWVDLAAPGVGITSTVPFSGGNGFAGWSGTSMSTAFVSGAAALLLAHAAPPESVAAQLVASAGSLDASDPGYGGALGGQLNVARALGLDVANPPPPTELPLLPAGYLPFVMR